MAKLLDKQFKRDLTKLIYLAIMVLGTAAVFVVTPALSSPTLLSLVVSMLISPWVAHFERKGYSRTFSIILIFSLCFCVISILGFLGFQSSHGEWSSLKEKVPSHFNLLIQKLQSFEEDLKARYPFFQNSLHLTHGIFNFGRETGKWFLSNGPALAGELLTWMLLVPLFSFVLLKEGRTIRKRFFQLVPNRYFESFFLVTTEISNSITDYLRAKLIEALFLGILVTLGLTLIHTPYVLALGFIAGITNIVPYLGPFLGAIPGIFIATLETQNTNFLLAVTLVYVIANLIDTFFIFPVVVAKLVKLHPLILIVVVAVGQRYYGLVGMLISIPIATALKVVIREIYLIIYEQKSVQTTWNGAPEEDLNIE